MEKQSSWNAPRRSPLVAKLLIFIVLGSCRHFLHVRRISVFMVANSNSPTMILYVRIPLICLAASTSFRAAAGFVGGWASRNLNGCPSNENSCGSRGAGFYACCPSNTYCLSPVSIPGFSDNTGCCPTGQDCSLELRTHQVCADDTWNIYNVTGFPFCCARGYQGGVGPNNGYDSCRTGGFPATETALPLATSGIRPTSTPSSSTSASTAPASTTADTPAATGTSSPGSQNSTPSSSGQLSRPTIAGIAIGAVAGVTILGLLAWWIGRRAGVKKGNSMGFGGSTAELGGANDGRPPNYPESKPMLASDYSLAPVPAPPPAPMTETQKFMGYGGPNELPGSDAASELPGYPAHTELPA
ncbi:hypothetical protein Dda_1728 [Drechslerella dactyloides]|uniref:Uncharacterized protein n=1 Tax=Drechslerella dactyloides TaxID=74499 RepID=A0AAD6NM19_DREDA|nr:hypothetical protein Dda_1728 [Drechslerella dactyloides]